MYVIRNTVNGHRYVGSAVCWKRRWLSHVHNLRKGLHNTYIQNAWDKYGESKFEIHVVARLQSRESMLWLEAVLINAVGVYNLSKFGAVNNAGWHHSEETKHELSLKHKGKTLTAEHRANIAKTWKPRLTPEHYKSIGDKQRGKPKKQWSAEDKAKHSEAQKKRFAAQPVSEATRLKKSENAQRIWAERRKTWTSWDN